VLDVLKALAHDQVGQAVALGVHLKAALEVLSQRRVVVVALRAVALKLVLVVVDAGAPL